MINDLANKRVLLGVTGGIAAYKSAELVRELTARGAEVQVVMTEAARAFIGELTLQALSGREVRSALFDPRAEAGMGHIELARWPDLVVIAPATADTLARLAAGLADDLLTTVVLACAAPLLVAPAMNQQMWSAPATVDNLARLTARGVQVCGPASGVQACGDVGAGRMSEPADIADAVQRSLQTGELAGLRVLVTAGPTREPLDPVRFLTNRSSGRMGYAVAAAALDAGAAVTLVSGPVSIAPPPGARLLRVETAADMAAAVEAEVAGADIFIATAAVADYTVAEAAPDKIKKTGERLVLELTRTTDILATVAAREPAPFTVGFAAETQDVEHYARDKLARKGLDMIAANRVGEGMAFDTEDNELQVFWAGGDRRLGRAAKTMLARQLLALVAERYRLRDAGRPAALRQPCEH